jgi:hypothetical protein
MSVETGRKLILNLAGKKAVVVPANRGTSVYIVERLKREDAKKEIDQIEIQSSISQLIWRIFDENRRRLSQRLDISELDIALLEARIVGVKIDGFQVMNPIGFRGVEIELEINQVLAEKKFSREVGQRLVKGETVDLFFQPGASLARELREEKKHDFVLTEFFSGRTGVYRAERNRIIYLNDFDWSEEEFLEEAARELDLSFPAAEEICRRYFRNGLSSGFSRKLKNIFSDLFSGYLRGVEAARHNSRIRKSPIYLASSLFGSAKPRLLGLTEREDVFFLDEPDLGELAARELELNEINRELNRLAKQRVKWLVSKDEKD